MANSGNREFARSSQTAVADHVAPTSAADIEKGSQEVTLLTRALPDAFL